MTNLRVKSPAKMKSNQQLFICNRPSQSTNDDGINQLMKRADKAMYRVKKEGRGANLLADS